MKFFRIRTTTDLSVLGHHPQIREIAYNGNVNDPKFIDKVFFEKATFDPITASAILDDRSNLNDLVQASGMGFTLKLLMNGKLKSLFQKYRSHGLEFFRSPVVYKDEIHDDYWVMNVFKTNEELLNFSKCIVQMRRRKPEGGTKLSSVDVDDYEDFERKKNLHALNNEFLTIQSLAFKSFDVDDFFVLRNVSEGVGYYISEKFKNDLLENEISGIDYEEVET